MPFTSEFNYLFGITPSYNCAEIMLQFHSGDLDKPIQVVEAPESFGQHFILHTLYWSANEDIARRVYSEIALRLNGGNFDVVQLAAHFNISKHTLARRLKAASTSYGQLLERVRRDKALHLLLNSQVSVDEIAEQLGFQELGSFSRAFKGWCGCSPSQCRQAATIC